MKSNDCGGACASDTNPVSIQELSEVVAHNATVSHQNTVAFVESLGQMQFLLGFILQKLNITTEELQTYASSLKPEEKPQEAEETEYPKDAFIFGN